MTFNSISLENISLFNANLRYENPKTIISFVLKFAQRPLITTSFGANSAALLYAATHVDKNIQVVWCDTGFNTEATKKHANKLIDTMQLNVEIFRPRVEGVNSNISSNIPDIASKDFDEFAERVKLEPFSRAMQKHDPDVWFTTVRKDQTPYRNTLDILSFTNKGVLRVSPFYYFTDKEMQTYLENRKLPVEHDYFDPVKASEKRECGIQYVL